VGPKGRLVGVDVEEKVVVQARRGAEEAGFAGVAEFQQVRGGILRLVAGECSTYSLPVVTESSTRSACVLLHLEDFDVSRS
jgi:hypothetical protein